MKQTHAAQTSAATLGQLYETELAAALAATDRNDNEALHDFRVALRRLEVLVKQLARHNKQRKRVAHDIRGLMRQSDKGRDAQVMLAWLKTEWPRLDERDQAGARYWQRTLERAQKDCLPVPRETSTVLKRMVRPLAMLLPLDSLGQLPFGQLLAQRLEQQSNELSSLMKAERVDAQLHLVRLKAKTVRYLLLPLCDESPACTQAEEALHQLQTLLGEWHDTVLRQQSLTDTLRKRYEKHTAGRAAGLPPESPGLITLIRATILTQQRLAARIKRKYLRDGAAHLSGLLHQAISSMRMAATGHG